MRIIGTGAYIPGEGHENSKISSNPEWVEKMLGIKERHLTDHPSSWLGANAAISAINNAGLLPEDIDMMIVATSTPDKLTPSTAAIIQSSIWTLNAVCFDINAVCSGFVYAMSLAETLVKVYKNILIIGVDTFSRITDWSHRNNVFFGDGAGAVVVTDGGYSRSKIFTDGSGAEAFVTNHGEKFKMDGKAVYEAGITLLPQAIRSVTSIDEVDWMLPHQASKNMLKALSKEIGLPWGKVKTNMEYYANTAAASIPILLAENSFKQGDKLLLAAIGSGWTYGAMLIRW